MIVVDTSGILASKDETHPQHAAVATVISDGDDELLLSPFVLAESDYVLATRLGQAAAREFLDEVGGKPLRGGHVLGPRVAVAEQVIAHRGLRQATAQVGRADATGLEPGTVDVAVLGVVVVLDDHRSAAARARQQCRTPARRHGDPGGELV